MSHGFSRRYTHKNEKKKKRSEYFSFYLIIMMKTLRASQVLQKWGPFQFSHKKYENTLIYHTHKLSRLFQTVSMTFVTNDLISKLDRSCSSRVIN